MITIFLRGGLGNQMFQYALGYNLAQKYDTNLVFDTTFLNDRTPRGGVTFFGFDLPAIFDVTPRFTLLGRISQTASVPVLWLGIDLAFIKMKDFFGIQKILKESRETFDPAVLAAGKSALLWGYWQNEKYFTEIADDVCAAFHFKLPLAGQAAHLAEEIKKTNSVSLHVRRGDYVTAKGTLALMGDTNIPYYEAAVVYMGKHVKDPHFFVISNDPAWCKEHMKISFPTTYLDKASAGPRNAYHLELMSLCKHNIIANSTFSWWGAWLNRNPNKIVVAPARWYADGRETDIVPAEWTKI